MIKRIYIDNFKSLVNFSLPPKDEEPLGKFVCIVGLNGAGKSTLLQACDFLAQLVAGGMVEWLESREWVKSDLVTKGSRKSLINFRVEIEGVLATLIWSGSYNASLHRCTSETLEMHPSAHEPNRSPVIMRLESGAVSINENRYPLAFEYEGSIFSQFRAASFSNDASFAVSLLRVSFQAIKSLELLSPNLMRKPSRDAVDVGVGGEDLAAFISGLSAADRERLVAALKKFYPNLTSITSRSTKYGWKRISITEDYGVAIETEARHINDGLLRLLAIITQTIAEPGIYKALRSEKLSDAEKRNLGSMEHTWYQSILLDEIENGINPELMKQLVSYLLVVNQQIILTTHSPLLLNYLSDEKARESVFYLYRNKRGETCCRRLFLMRHMERKLEFMGPGEAYADTELFKLNELALDDEGNEERSEGGE